MVLLAGRMAQIIIKLIGEQVADGLNSMKKCVEQFKNADNIARRVWLKSKQMKALIARKIQNVTEELIHGRKVENTGRDRYVPEGCFLVGLQNVRSEVKFLRFSSCISTFNLCPYHISVTLATYATN